MKVYQVSYEAGVGGTWLTWFINQHGGFQQYPCHFRKDKLDYTVGNELMWYHDTDSWVNTVAKNEWNDKSNVVYKLFPKHNIYDIDRAESLLANSNTIAIIVPYVNEELKQEFVKRNVHSFAVSVERAVLNLDYNRINCTSSDDSVNLYSRYKDRYGITTLDMGRLLNCNSNEYHQLLKTIHCDELSNWKQLCAEYKANVFPS
tara:strand:+ start:95 stop:703 length:609 start_codon:yes stop_codon:yes gene_type:complete